MAVLYRPNGCQSQNFSDFSDQTDLNFSNVIGSFSIMSWLKFDRRTQYNLDCNSSLSFKLLYFLSGNAIDQIENIEFGRIKLILIQQFYIKILSLHIKFLKVGIKLLSPIMVMRI